MVVPPTVAAGCGAYKRRFFISMKENALTERDGDLTHTGPSRRALTLPHGARFKRFDFKLHP